MITWVDAKNVYEKRFIEKHFLLYEKHFIEKHFLTWVDAKTTRRKNDPN